MSALAYGDLDARGEAERRNGLRQVPRGQDAETVGYWSTCLGKAVWIRNDLRQAIPRRREDLSFPTFTFELASNPSADGVKGQERFAKGFDKLQRAQAREAKRKGKPLTYATAKTITIRLHGGRVRGVDGLPRGYLFEVVEV